MKKNNWKVLLALHLLLMLYSAGGILTKMAAGYDFLSLPFILCYGGMIVNLGVYAIGWQQIIKRMPLTTAFSNKAITVVWGIFWGWLVFDEKVTAGKIIGATVVMAGVVLYSIADGGETYE